MLAVAGEQIERRLAAILIADVAGYSRLIGMDEEGTLTQLNAHHAELIAPKLTEHRGSIIRTTGDGLLVLFVGAVDALRCAVEIQRGMVQRNAQIPRDRRIEFRMGVVEDASIHAMGSTWQPGWRRWQTRVAFACRAGCTKTRKAVCSGSASPLKISVSISSRTLRARCTSIASSWSKFRRRRDPRWRSPIGRQLLRCPFKT